MGASIFSNNSTVIASRVLKETCLFQESLYLGKPRAVASYQVLDSSPSLNAIYQLGVISTIGNVPSNIVDILLFRRLSGEQS